MMMLKERNPAILHFEMAKSSVKERKAAFLHFEVIFGELVVGGRSVTPTPVRASRVAAMAVRANLAGAAPSSWMWLWRSEPARDPS